MKMKKLLFIFLMGCTSMTVWAQPTARRQAQQKTQTNANNITTRARLDFPTAAPMEENVVWRRDIYREVDLMLDPNAGLYYPLDGNESFVDAAKVNPKAFLDNYHIYYERTDRGIHIDDSDIPSKEVKGYYVKESAYFDQVSATFHTKVLALCPIMQREDDFGDGSQKYPLFWVRYDDLAPFLAKQQIMTSNLNNAATMSIDDFFTRNQYRGKIYKTTNMLGKTLAQYCNTDSALTKEQKRIEAELVALSAGENLGGRRMAKYKNRRDKVNSSSKRSRGESSTGSSARVTVRRQRH